MSGLSTYIHPATGRTMHKTEFVCSVHGVQDYVWAEGDECEPHCFLCDTERRRREEDEKAREDIRRRKVQAALNAANLHKSLQALSAREWEPETEKDKACKCDCLEWLKTDTVFLLLLGRKGTGKTYMGIGLAADKCRDGGSAYFTTLANLDMRIRATYNKASAETSASIYNELLEKDILVLDEFSERTWAQVASFVESMLIDRELLKKKTVIISNYQRDELARIVGDHIVSRIDGSGQAVYFLGRDRRQK